jgi:RimJ/RimL family protein N-acetyltransferase
VTLALKHCLPDTLTDGVVRLDGHTVADAEAHWLGEDDEMRRRFEAPRRATLDETRAAMLRWIDARAVGGPRVAYALRLPSGVLIGGCEIRRLSPDRASVSYWIFPPFRGAGYAARALTLLSDVASSIPDLDQLEAHVDDDNTASRATAVRANYVEAGTVEDESDLGPPIRRVLYVRRIVRAP